MGEPVNISEQSINNIVTGLSTALRGAPTSPAGASSSGGGGGGADAPNLKKVDGFVATLLQSLGKINQGASTTGEGLTALGTMLGKVPGFGQSLQAGFGAAGTAVSDYAQGMKTASMQGVSFGNNIGEFAKTIGNSGQTSQEFNRQMASMAPAFSGLGPVLGASAKNLSQFQAAFQESQIGQNLLKMGYSTDQVNQFANTALANSKTRDISDKKSRDEALQQTTAWTEAILRNSQQTGVAADILMKKNMLDSDNIEVTASIIEGGEEAQRAYSNMLPALVEMGPNIKSLAEEAFSPEGIRTPEAAAKFAALGDAGPLLMQAVEAQKIAAKDGATQADKDRAASQMQRAQLAIDERMRNKDFLMMARNPDIDGGASRKILADQQQRIGSQMAAQAALKKQGQPSDIKAAREFQAAQVTANVAGVDPATGKPQPGAAAIAAASQADVAGRAAANALAIAGIEKLGGAADRAAGSLDKAFKTPKQIIENPKVLTGGTGRTPPKDPGREGTRHEGTEGILGKMFEPKDTTVKLTAGENVLDPINAQKWASVGGSAGFDKMFSQLSSMKPAGTDKQPSTQMPKMDNIKMPFDISSITGAMPKMDNIKMPFDTKSLAGAMPKMDNIKMPFDDKQISNMFGNIKMPAGPDTSKLSDMVGSMTSSMSTGVPMGNDSIGNLKTQISSMGTDLAASKGTTAKLPEIPAPSTEGATSTSTTATGEVFNTDVLNALNNLNKMMGQLVSNSEAGNSIAESMTRKITSSNRFEG